MKGYYDKDDFKTWSFLCLVAMPFFCFLQGGYWTVPLLACLALYFDYLGRHKKSDSEKAAEDRIERQKFFDDIIHKKMSIIYKDYLRYSNHEIFGYYYVEDCINCIVVQNFVNMNKTSDVQWNEWDDGEGHGYKAWFEYYYSNPTKTRIRGYAATNWFTGYDFINSGIEMPEMLRNVYFKDIETKKKLLNGEDVDLW